MTKREKRLTRAEKIERSRTQANELRIYQSKPWWPEKAHTEDEAVTKTYNRLLELDQIGNDPEMIQEFQQLSLFLTWLPAEHLAKAKAMVVTEDKREEQVAA